MRKHWNRVINWGLFICLFLLPWQTVWIVHSLPLAGIDIAYGRIEIFVVEILILLLAIVKTGHGWNIDKEHRSVLMALAFVVCSIGVSTIFSSMPALGLSRLIHIISGSALFLLILDREVDTVFAMKGFVLGLLIPVLFGFIQVMSGYSPASAFLGLSEHRALMPGDAVIWNGQGERVLRAYGSFPHPNIFAGFLVAGIFAANTLRRNNKHWTIVIAALCIALFLTFSHGAWLGFLFALFSGLFIHILGKKGVPLRKALPILTIVLLAILITSTLFLLKFEQGPVSLMERIDYLRIWPSLQQNIFIGSGPGTSVFSWYEMDAGHEWWQYQPIHNIPLLLITEIGLLGLAALTFFLSRVDRINFSQLPSPHAMNMLMACTALLIIAFLDHYLWSFWPGLVLTFFTLGLTSKSNL